MNANEETIFTEERENVNPQSEEKTVLKDESVAEEPVIEENVEDEDTAKKKHSTAGNILLGATGGIVLGAAATLFSGASIGKDDIDGPDGPGTPPVQPVTHEEVHFATNVNDSMSFNEAFAAARHEVGAGGAFVWHGTVYGTYYGNEWNAMTSEEQSQFTHDAVDTYHDKDDVPSASHEHATASAGTASTGHANAASASTASTGHANVSSSSVVTEHEDVSAASETATTTPEYGNDVAQAESQETEIEVHVLGQEEGHVFSDGSVANIGYAEIGGETAMFIDVIDVNGNEGPDGIYDVMVIDTNGDTVIDANEVAAVDPDTGMTVDYFDAAMQMESPVDDMYASMPDYTNDADVSALA